ncbi:STT3 domain-containing protein [Sulfurimonas sp.]|uniref:STT3 domain-containing protein n=1 Tax=Sulfurimonas sp. TaxID=2022749 RepID=UPI0034598CB0
MGALTKETKVTLLYIAIAFLFSVAVRLIWYYQFSGYEPFIFNSQFMINTNDGYYYAEGARDILSGINQQNDLSPIDSAASRLTAFFATILPISFESLILFMPVVLSSLIVVPIILIAKNLKNLEMGLIAALLASIAHSYYNRTMIGYYDTDMLNIVLPMFLLWSIIWAIKTNEDKYLLITAFDILVYRWWYPQSYSLEFAFFGLILFYALVFDRKNLYNYKLLALMMFAMLNLDGFIRFPLVLAAFYISKRFDKYVYHILAASVVLFFASDGFNPIWVQLKGYVFKDALVVGEEGMKLHFYSVMQTIREAGKIPFETFADRISGHMVTFVASVVGFAYLAYRHKIMLFGLPLIGLGFIASVGGLRLPSMQFPFWLLELLF